MHVRRGGSSYIYAAAGCFIGADNCRVVCEGEVPLKEVGGEA